jgi:predicted O-methyltransferase YrrM
METLRINQRLYYVKPDEFVLKPHEEYNNLRIYPKVGELERVAGLLCDLTEGRTDSTLCVFHWTHGGFVTVQCAEAYRDIYVYTKEVVEPTSHLPGNIVFNKKGPEVPFVVYVNDSNLDMPFFPQSYILCNSTIRLDTTQYMAYPLSCSDLILYVPHAAHVDFRARFGYYIREGGYFEYDNLIHLCIMVKNAGPLFEQVLTDNLPFVDRWTVLDTGSTDGTQDVVRKVLGGKKGQLYEEPFINFRESRNRCLDLAGKNCKYLVMLDDTYALRGDLREFLNTVRGDQFASSYSLLIKSDDVEYYSNRVTMTKRGLRYIYTIHEVIQDNDNKENVVIPKHAASIHDYRADYMEKRTMDRKQYDLGLLHDMVRDDPTNPRHYYYLAQTYNLLEDYENAAFWFQKRAFTELEGHHQEAVDSCFELARLYNFKMNRPWEECKPLYEKAYEMDTTRPDALYFLGIHYHLKMDNATAFDYFKRAFALGYPLHAQFSLKPTLSFHFLPKFLAPLCYEFKEWTLGVEVCYRFLENNKEDADQYAVIQSWLPIFQVLCTLPTNRHTIVPTIPKKPIVTFVADGGWGPWTGSDILTKGVGGSETYIIEIARWVQASGQYDCYVFCNCPGREVFEGVTYLPISMYPTYITYNTVYTSIISRYSEYVPVTIEGAVDNIYLVLHDLGPTGVVIPQHSKLKKILCLTDWHVSYFLQAFPMFKGITESFYYGVDTARFKPSLKVKNSFIYSSFPNRGLLPLLQMWPRIKAALPDAVLNVYSDIEGDWVNRVAKDQMDEIRRLLADGMDGVVMHGWVSKGELADAWSKADIWLYPCIFQETFCLTALEAAATKTLAIGAPLAALQETIGNRGILIPGEPMSQKWQDKAVEEVLRAVQDNSRKSALLEANYQWACSSTWRQRGAEFIVKYLEPNQINVADMYNWTHDLPAGGGHKARFEEALVVANPTRILEIGTYAGTSLIGMLKLYPEATGVAIDAWRNYEEEDLASLKRIEESQVERVFYQNLERVNMVERVTALKGDSVEKLLDLVQKGEKFDFVYVDGSHLCLDCYADMVLAWKLVGRGGVLAVDDVLYHYDKAMTKDPLGYPLKAKEHFMKKYEGQYRVLSDSYRVFLQKL